MFYVYEWYIEETNEIFYVGKGCKNRYKQTTKRNKLFQEFIKRFNCKNRIIKYFEFEEDAFIEEHKRIIELKSIGQCVCNLDYGGKGGCNFVWTDDMKSYKSTYNPMKAKEQRDRMKQNNPMKRKDIQEKVAQKIRKPVIINNIKYDGVKIAAEILNVTEQSITIWCNRGYDTNGNPCRYENKIQKQYSITKIKCPKATTPKAILIDGKRFETVKQGAEYLGVWSESIIRAIKSNRQCKGHNVSYDNQQPSLTNFDNSSEEGSTTNG